MLDNHLYNLMNQMVEEHKSLWRIEKMYKNDASQCQDCQLFWEKLRKDKEEHVSEVMELLKKHFQ